MPVANGMPLAAIGAREEVPPCCVTVISAYACRQVALRCETVSNAESACDAVQTGVDQKLSIFE